MKQGRPEKPIPYTQILKLVENGLGIKQAIKKIGYKGTGHVYNKLTDEQKAELRALKISHKKFGNYYGLKMDDIDFNDL